MELQHYALKPPYTRTYFTVPSYVQDTLRRDGLSPIQADGECLFALAPPGLSPPPSLCREGRCHVAGLLHPDTFP